MNLFKKLLGKSHNHNMVLSQQIHNVYKVDGLTNYDQHPIYTSPEAFPNFQEELERFKKLILENHSSGKSTTFYKFGDGDYYFLKGLPHGSAKPGNRALSKPLSEIELQAFRKNSMGSDFYMCELYPENIEKFHEVLPNKTIDFPAEFAYICVASNWFVKNFHNIGIIGADEKVKLIKKLAEKSEYRDSLDFDGFTSYISVPQKYSCDNLESQLSSLEEQLKNSRSDLFLVGIGHLKSGVLGELKKFKNATFIDVGSGIDALAGIVDTERPYFGEWTNFQLKNYEYAKMDFLGFNGKNIEVI